MADDMIGPGKFVTKVTKDVWPEVRQHHGRQRLVQETIWTMIRKDYVKVPNNVDLSRMRNPEVDRRP